MAECRLCGKRLPWLHSMDAHTECQDKHQWGRTYIADLVYRCGISNADPRTHSPVAINSEAEKAARASFVPASEIRSLYLLGWKRAMEEATNGGKIPSPNQFASLRYLSESFKFTVPELKWTGVEERMQRIAQIKAKQDDEANQASIVRLHKDALIISLRQNQLLIYSGRTSHLPFLWQPGETLLWVFEKVQFLEDKISRTRHYESTSQYQGSGVSYHGYSVHSGNSTRTGESYTTEHESLQFQEMVTLALTDKSLYFGGKKAHRIPLNKIIGMRGYTDALEVCKEAANPKRQVFLGMDGAFADQVIHWLRFNKATD